MKELQGRLQQQRAQEKEFRREKEKKEREMKEIKEEELKEVEADAWCSFQVIYFPVPKASCCNSKFCILAAMCSFFVVILCPILLFPSRVAQPPGDAKRDGGAEC